MNKKHILLVVSMGLIFAVTAMAQSESALVQASKQKSTDTKARRVFTNDDYPERPDLAPTAPATGAAISAEKGGAAKEGVPSTPDPKQTAAKTDEKAPETKESKQGELEKKLETSKKEEQDLRQKLAALQQKADSETDPNRRGMYEDMISNQQTTLSEYRRNQEDLQKQIDDEKNKKQN